MLAAKSLMISYEQPRTPMIGGSANEGLAFANVDDVHRDEAAAGSDSGERKFGGYDSRKYFNC